MSIIKANDKIPFCRPPNPKTVRRLFQSQTNDSTDSPYEDLDCLTVFLRIKPSPNVNLQKNSIDIVENQKLICKPPVTARAKKSEYVEYTFSRIFGPETKQEEVFRGCVVPRVQDLIDGKNSLIFAYGTTCSGKTYTVQGTAANPGLIPRTLHTIFSHIRPDREAKYAPNFAKEVEHLDHHKRRDELIQKDKLFREYNSLAKSFKAGSYASLVTESKNFLEILDEDFVELKSTMPTCTIWISFIELYNEQIFDLLDSKKALKLAMDQYSNFYVKGLRYICVDSTEEAYSVYKLGRQNSSIASTRMNDSSSRSHCIFTIKIINHDRKAALSSLSICDLAGTERQAKAQNSGVRMKESGTINESIFHLNKCLRAIRENQNRSISQMIPYRDSNLTKLFHSAFQEKSNEKIVMIVNINPIAELYDETQQVLKVCAIASEIRKTVFSSKTIEQSSNESVNDDFDLGNEFSSFEEFSSENFSEFDSEKIKRMWIQMKRENDKLKDENEKLKDENLSSTQINEAQNDHIKVMMTEILNLKNLHEEQLIATKRYYRSKLDDITKAVSVDDASDADLKKLVEEKESYIQKLKTLLEMKEEECERLDGKYREELSNMAQELDEKTRILQQKQNSIENFEEKVEELKQKLSDDAVEHEVILAHLEKDRDEKVGLLTIAESRITALETEIKRIEEERNLFENKLKDCEEMQHELLAQLTEKKRTYNTRSKARTPLKNSIKENTDYNLMEIPAFKSKKSKATDKIITIMGPDDSIESDVFRSAKKEIIESDNKENTLNGLKKKKKLFNLGKSPVGQPESLISFDTSDIEITLPNSTETLVKCKSNVATPAQTIKSMKKNK